MLLLWTALWAGAHVLPPPGPAPTTSTSGGGSRRRYIEYVKLKPRPVPTRAVKRHPIPSIAQTDVITEQVNRALTVTFTAPLRTISTAEVAEHNARAIELTEQLFADMLEGEGTST